MTQPPAAHPPESICLLRLSALGDVCNCIALGRALQRAWPQIRLTWIIGKLEHRLVEDMAGIEFIVFDKQAGWDGIRGLRRALAGRRFDILLQAQVSARANLLSLLVRARRRIGFDRARAREGHGWFINERIPELPFQHQALAFLEFARCLGVDTSDLERAPPIPAQAREFALQHQSAARRAVLISPASSHAGRNWTVAGYARVGDWVVASTGRPVILIGGPSRLERELGAAIADAMQQPVLNLIGQDTLKQALAMIERAACLVTPDAGPAHFGAALGTPVVGLYAATWSRRSGPLGSLELCVDQFPEAARRFTGKPPEQLRWGRRLEQPGVMDLIEPEAVIERLAEALQATRD
jgi:heptosyltransferase I